MRTKKNKKLFDNYTGELIVAAKSYTNRILVGIPTTGLIRYEWAVARYGQVIPCNWSQVECLHFYSPASPVGFQVADARNLICNVALRENFEWVFFIDHDVVLSPITVLRWNDYMLKKDFPVWCGLYFTKSVPSEPLVYRGRGNSYYRNWKIGDKIWVDGIHMGNTVIHTSILRAMAPECEEYVLETKDSKQKVRRIFITPAQSFWDPEKLSWFNNTGTEDLNWCSRVIEGKYLQKAGWKEIAPKKYPFMLDTGIFCRHIDHNGIQYPSMGEELEFIKR